MVGKRHYATIGFRGGYAPLPAVISRLFNFLLSLILSIISLPVFLIIYAVVRLQDRGPGLYKGIRFGINQKPFTMYKFRTLIPDAEKKIGDEYRIVHNVKGNGRDKRSSFLIQIAKDKPQDKNGYKSKRILVDNTKEK